MDGMKHAFGLTAGLRKLACAVAAATLAGTGTWVSAQPALPVSPAAAAAKGTDAKKGAESKRGEEGVKKVATTSGPIKVDEPTDDAGIEKTLETLLPIVPGVRSIEAEVSQGVVKLDGQVDDDDTRNEIIDLAKHVEGVRMVIPRLATDAEVLTAPELVIAKLRAIWDVVSRHWLLALLALAIVFAFTALARVFNAHSETLLAPLVNNVMLRSVLGSLISSMLVIGGLMFGLSVLNLTQVVLSVLGLAGVVGLAVGFAFKDIAENFIASVLLGVRRPFQVGDYVTVAGQSGMVRSLNTRATVLVTLEGNHVRIPNNIIYKEILVNSSASASYRGTFDVVIPYDASTADGVGAITRALREVEGVLPDPQPRALVEALEPGGVRLRAYYWVPVRDSDWFKINSDARMQAKVALQQAKVLTPAPAPSIAATPGGPAPGAANGRANDTATQAEVNLRKDTRAAQDARDAPPDGKATPMEHVMNQPETRVSDEGANLLAAAS